MIKAQHFFIVFLFLLLQAGTTHAQINHWDGRHESMSIGPGVSWLEDKEGQFTIGQVVRSGDFRQSTQNILSFDGSNSVYWIKISIENNSRDSLLLELAQAKLQEADLYYKNDSGQWSMYRAGCRTIISQRPVHHHFQLFPVLHSGDYYLRIRANEVPLPIGLWECKVYEQKMSNQKIIYGVYMGMMIFVMFINLFFFVSLKRLAHLHYAFFVFMLASFSALCDGYILYVFPSCDLNFWYTLNPIINQPNGLLYCLMFLQVRKYDPKLFRFSVFVLIYFASYIVWHTFLPTMSVLKISQMHALIGIMLEAILGIRVGRKGYKLGYYYAVTYLIFFAFCAIEITYMRTGSPAYFFELSYVSIGIFFEVFILSFLLSKRFEWEQDASDLAKANALQLLFAQTQENERIVKEQNVILEQKVAERTAELRKEKRKSDDLLLNILPGDVADELKATGTAKAKSYESVSVLFTDIKDFTRISQNQSPEELVLEIDECFRAFDAIINWNGLEKIKTIGDAYMCAAGLPVKTDTHATDIVKAAQEIREYMEKRKEEKIKRNETYFEIRLGISSGSVVAGIVGSSKFAYDIWGDTVNTASRMEQNSEAGKINVSHATYELIKDKYTCTYRGEIDTKGKGLQKMYYVD